jgi:hypothetical protein
MVLGKSGHVTLEPVVGARRRRHATGRFAAREAERDDGRSGRLTASRGLKRSLETVASSSAWTAVVARQVKIQDDMQIAFNTYYDATTVKPPACITDVNATVFVTQ